jgi:hypothetical protein
MHHGIHGGRRRFFRWWYDCIIGRTTGSDNEPEEAAAMLGERDEYHRYERVYERYYAES